MTRKQPPLIIKDMAGLFDVFRAFNSTMPDQVMSNACDEVTRVAEDGRPPKETVMTTPQPIDTAPRDGTVILTDCGIAALFDADSIHEHWLLCSSNGMLLDGDEDAFECEPEWWAPLPAWVKQ